MKTKPNICALFLILFSVTVAAQTDSVDRYIEAEMRKLHIPGLSMAVVSRGKIIRAKGYGLANIEAGAPATPRTVYEIGSISKQFTAAAVMLLVEDGKLGLDDRLTKFFPEAPRWWDRITLRHLLNHTSGIRNHVAVPDYLDLFKTSITGKTFPSREEILKEFYRLPSEFAPGETWSYDNTGYYLLGIIIEQASGRQYWQFLEERIFRPLGMNSTYSTDPRPVVPHRAAGYEWVGGAFENRPYLAPFIPFAAGCISSTVEDLARWDAALQGEHLLKESSLDQLWTPARTNDGAMPSFDHGFGWFIENYRGRRDVHHSGGTPGFSSVIHRFVDDRLTVIILTNHADRMIDQMALHIAEKYVPALKRTDGITDPDPYTTQRLSEIMSGLLEGRFDAAHFTPAMQIHLATASGKALWKWYAYQGPLRSLTFMEREDNRTCQILRYRAVLGDAAYLFSFRLTQDGRIAQIYWW